MIKNYEKYCSILDRLISVTLIFFEKKLLKSIKNKMNIYWKWAKIRQFKREALYLINLLSQ